MSILLLLAFGVQSLLAPKAAAAAPPRLVVVVSIDQLPRAYLDRFETLFPAGGFRRLMNGGADFPHCQQNHFQTVTGPGHAVILSGAYPVHNGIVSNMWFSRATGALAGSVDDKRFPLLPPRDSAVGELPTAGVSPLALRSSTVGDVLRAATGLRAKVVSVSLKDRGAVLMGGARPTGAYWLDAENCRFVTSSYYTARLPAWVTAFNAKKPCASYLGHAWTKLREDVEYRNFADQDDVPYERALLGLGRTFPHPVNVLIEQETNPADETRKQHRYAAVVTSPFGNDLLLRFTQAAVEGEGLGRDDVPDILTVSFSSNDYAGHLYGPNSQEILDMTLRTDRVLAELMRFLDGRVGASRWVLALTSDHGTAPIPEYLERIGLLIPRADHYRFDSVSARKQVEHSLTRRLFGSGKAPEDFPGFFEMWHPRTHPFLYVRRGAVDRLPRRISFDELLSAVADEIEALDGVARVYRRSERGYLATSQDVFDQRAYRSWDAVNGGDLLIQLEPYWLHAPAEYATSHGTPYTYDTHVPMLLYGSGVHAGRFDRAVEVVDLASTLAHLLGVAPPPQNEGQPLVEALGASRSGE